MSRNRSFGCSCSRRDFLVRGLYGIGVGAGLPLVLSRTSAALAAQALEGTSVEKHPERILVVIELAGGNDGLNTVVPYTDPAYYRARPNLGIKDRDVLKAAEGFGFHPSMVGFERLYKDGLLGVVHGCGYDHPSLSHFSSMGFWHTGVPNGGDPLGWLGRLADETYDTKTRNVIVNLGNSQSLAVRSAQHSPLVFDDPARFRREGADEEKRALAELSQPRTTTNATLEFLASTAQNATESSDFVRQASAGYRTPVDYGSRRRPRRQPPARGIAHRGRHADAAVLRHLRGQLVRHARAAGGSPQPAAHVHRRRGPRVHGRPQADRPGRRGGGHDLHRVRTPGRRERQPRHRSRHRDADVHRRQGRQGGFYGKHPSLTDLDDGNMKMTTDFRRVYATMIKEWLGYDDTAGGVEGPLRALGRVPVKLRARCKIRFSHSRQGESRTTHA